MPEGHTIHRYARLHRRVLVGAGPVRAWSPQGRFADGAARLDDGTVLGIDAHGKHLLYRWGDAGGTPTGDVLHVHLGLFGRFRTLHGEPSPPTAGTRLALHVGDERVGSRRSSVRRDPTHTGDEPGAGDAGDRADRLDPRRTIYLAGATAVEILTPDEAAAIPARLGPDPLDRRADPERFLAALRRRSLPIGEALLDQAAIAGIGNVYRAELLFRAGVDPSTPAREVGDATATAIWQDAVHLLTLGERSGRIVTVEPEDVGRRRRSDLRRDEQRYAYKRDGRPCHRCGTPIVSWTPRTRTIWACPTCQQLGRRPAG